MPNRLILTFVSAAMSLLAFVQPAAARTDYYGRWERLGTRTIDVRRDHDTINVSKNRGGFRQIKLSVRNNAIRVEQLVVVYASGVPDRIALRSYIQPYTDSRSISLRGGYREIRRIDMVMRSISNGRGKAKVEVWARR